MSGHTIVLTKYDDSILYMRRDDKGPLEFQLFSGDDDAIGNRYVCTIKDIQQSRGASFIRYDDNRTGFLKSTEYKCGTLLPLQLVKAGNHDKSPVFSDKLTLSGVYTVITNADRNFKISSKIDGERRKELKEEYGSFFADLEYGITLRTNSQDATLKDVIKEADELAGKLDEIITSATSRTPGSILFKKGVEWVGYCLDNNVKNLEKIITDDKEIFEILNEKIMPDIRKLNKDAYLSLYSDELLPLKKLYSTDSLLKEALSRKVWLRSGGFIYIESTESLTAIDVNSGKSDHGKDREEAYFKCNMEATEEICRQLRLRNISGIVIIDYINMKDEEHQRQLIKKLTELIEKDPVRTAFHDRTALGLVELTRQKIREPLAEQIKKRMAV